MADPWGEDATGDMYMEDVDSFTLNTSANAGPQFASSVVIFAFVFALELWRLFGEAGMNAIVYYVRHSMDPDVANAQAQQQKVSKIRKEHANTVAMDEFAKWAKLDRALKKETEILKTMMGATKQTSSRVNYIIKAVIYSMVAIAYGLLVFHTYSGHIVYQFDPVTLGPAPLSFFLRQPTGVIGGVSVLWFAVASHVVSNTLLRIIVILGTTAFQTYVQKKQ